MAGDQNPKSAGIEDRFPGFHMLFAELIEDHRPGGVAVAEIARQVGAFHQLIQQILPKLFSWSLK